MNIRPALSIITVTKNRAPLLTQALTSLLGQCKRGDEIIIVDASTDNTPGVVAMFSKKLPITYVQFLKSGYPMFYNEGAKRAKGDILVFFDDDCIATPTYLERIRNAHKNHPNAIIQGYSHSMPRGNLYVDIMGDHYRNWLISMRIGKNELKVCDSKNASIPRMLFWKYGGLSRSMSLGSEDMELGLRLRRHGIKIYLDRSIVVYHRERITHKDFLDQHRRFAASEGYLDRILPKSERFGVIPKKKLALHIQSFLRREWRYLSLGKIPKAVFVLYLYARLAWIRIWGYATNR